MSTKKNYGNIYIYYFFIPYDCMTERLKNMRKYEKQIAFFND